ncbi:HEAT repeat domain-containing protein [Halomarina salina]|uniref:HEAT repeat domain-containing protein n=1 Tax=Halomarina salina TaxID=1872699 RepID=A0ABD5RT64_9EURY|nr:HEAT repeat domain-containing protein [Halomarina salina]
MTPDTSDPLDGVDPASVVAADVDDAELRAALSHSNPLVRQRGVEVCGALAEDDVDAVRRFLDDVAALTADEHAPVALRAGAVLDTVAERAPAVLDGRLGPLATAAGSDLVNVQSRAAGLFGRLVVEHPDLVAPHADGLVEAIRATEPDETVAAVDEFVSDSATRQTIREHEEAERQRRISARRTLVNVVVAVTEARPGSSLDIAGDLVTLLDDPDAAVTGGAVDALGELVAADPDAVAPVGDRLVDCLDHPATVVRARAVRALGRLGDDAAVSDLRRVASAEDDEDVRELAEATANYLAEEA